MDEKITVPLNIAKDRAGRVDWKDLLRCVSEDLGSAMIKAEDEFLSIGADLRKFQERAMDISFRSSSVAGVLSGEGLMKAIGDIRGMLERIRADQNRADSAVARQTGKLREIYSISGIISGPVGDLKMIARNLQSLSMSIKLQSALLRVRDSGFATLSRDVSELTKEINVKSAGILEKLGLVGRMVQHTLFNLRKLEARHHGRTDAVLQESLAIIGSLSDRHKLATKATKAISEKSGEISRSMSEVVTAMQFSDITRQQIEHVVLSFGNLLDSGETRQDPEDTSRRAIPVEVIRVCEIQMAQLINARDELLSAVSRIRENLGEIAENVGVMLGQIRSLTDVRGRKGSFLSEMASGLSSMNSTLSALSENAETESELSAAIGVLAGAVSEISTFVHVMEHIESEVEVIALNAGIKAGQIGMQGAGLGLIASRVQQLSKDTHTPTTVISEQIRTLSGISEELSAELRVFAKGSGIKEMLPGLNQLLSSFREMNVNISSLLSGMERDASSLVGAIREKLSSMDVHGITSGILDNAVNELARISGHAVLLDGDEGKNHASGLPAWYTMKKEREIHGSVVSGSQPEHTISGRRVHKRGADSGRTGDNVEIF